MPATGEREGFGRPTPWLLTQLRGRLGFIPKSRWFGLTLTKDLKVHEDGILDGRASAFIDSMITHCDGGARYWP